MFISDVRAFVSDVRAFISDVQAFRSVSEVAAGGSGAGRVTLDFL